MIGNFPADDAVATDSQYEPKTGESSAWLGMIAESERAFQDYHKVCDHIDKLYASLDNLSAFARDREFQLFWANIQVIGPSIYARPPVPVVVPKFKDRRPLYRVSSELLERSTVVAFDLADINSTMLMIRDDLAVNARGAGWVRYDTKKGEKICPEWVARQDFLHEAARCWQEVGWVARRSWMTRDELRVRFQPHSGNAYLEVSMQTMKEDRDKGGATHQQKAAVWELWSKTEDKVVWVAEGCDRNLDEGKPHLNLEGFFPCPKPAYATTQRGGLIPVPDMLFYKDQLKEIDDLTSRIHALSKSLIVRGFYPAGAGEIADAIEAALKKTDDRSVLIPISNFAAFGDGGDTIIWLPLEVIANTISQCILIRRQIIEDVYQIGGISDVQRGETDPNETLGAQELKQMNGAVRVRDKQNELVRIARDMVRIAAEIMAENFAQKTLIDMSQMEIPSNADIAKQVKPLEEQARAIAAQIKQAQRDPQMMAQAQQDPEAAQQMLQQAQSQVQEIMQQVAKLQEQPTIEDVMKFLRDQKIRPFVLDIETDSTIQPDEQAEKAARTEFVTALGGMLNQFLPIAQVMPTASPLIGSILKFALAPFRAGRELEGQIDEAVEQMSAQASQPQPNPEAEKMQAEQQLEQSRQQFEMQKFQAEQEAKAQELQMKAQIEETKLRADVELKSMDAQAKQQENQFKLQQMQVQSHNDNQKHQQDMQKGQLEIAKLELTIAAQQQQAQIAAAAKAQDASMRETAAERNEDRAERAFERESAD